MYIKPISDYKTCEGGIKDLNKFDEGYCFEVTVLIPLTQFTPSQDQLEPKQAINQTWIFCHDHEKDKKRLMDAIIDLKLKIQHSLGLIVDYSIIEKQNENNLLAVEKNKLTPIDGHWVMIQDWTECSLKCGGGLKFQQYVCIPPKNGGKQCEGEAVRSISCNTQPCSDSNISNLDINSVIKNSIYSNGGSTNTLPPVIKTMAISNRPQQYDKCYLKESDVFMIKDDELTCKMVNKPRIPVRLILNDKTLSAFFSDNINTMIVTFSLSDSVFVRSQKYPDCFEIVNPVKTAAFCSLDSKPEFLEEWDYDFNLFKIQCRRDRVKSDVLLTEENKLEKEFKNRMKNIKDEMLLEIAQKNIQQVEDNEVNLISNKVRKTHLVSLMALQREMELEKLLEKEELEREKKENKELEKEIETEKKKEDRLNKAIKEKEIESQFNLSKVQATNEIMEIQEQTRKEIQLKRQQITNRLMELKKKQLRKKIALKKEIFIIKSKIAEKMNTYSRKGDAAICKDKIKQQVYCGTYFTTDYLKFEECKNADTYCEVCCENEFGNWHLIEREECFKGCKCE